MTNEQRKLYDLYVNHVVRELEIDKGLKN